MTSSTTGRSAWPGEAACTALPWLTLSALLVTATLLSSPALAERTLTVGVYHNPPKLFLDQQGRPGGILGELLQVIAAQEDWQLDTTPCSWQDCLQALDAGSIDLLPDVAWSELRARRFHFHETPALHSWSQIYQHPELSLDSILDLEGRRLAVLEGSVQQGYLKRLAESFGITLDLVPVTDYEGGFAQAARGDADAAVANRHFGDWQGQRLGLVPTPIMFQPARLHYASGRSDLAPVLAAIDQRLQAWKATPGSEYYQTLARWGVDQPEPPGIPKALWWSIAVVVLLLALVVAANLWLRRQVTERTAALADSEYRLASILDSVDAYIYIKTRDLRYSYVNHRVCELFERPASAILGRSDAELFDAATAAQLRANDERVIRRGERISEEEVNAIPGTAARRTFLSVKLPLRDTNGTIVALCGISNDVTEYREVLANNYQLAHFNSLTRLPNRRVLLERLEHRLANPERGGYRAALMVVDLDRFKLINDLCSPADGDRLLQQTGALLSRLAGPDDTVAHLGADEFCLLLERLGPDPDRALGTVDRLARRILDAISALRVADGTLSISASIGIRMLDEATLTADQAMPQADLALDQAKAAGGRMAHHFNPDVQQTMLSRVRREAELQRALERDELRLYHQVQVNGEGAVTGVEALVRWAHPEAGILPPGAFIPLAESSNLILPLGNWVLLHACQQLARWAREPRHAHLTMAINVSAAQFRDPAFLTRVEHTLHETGASAKRLVLEVTESTLMTDPEQVRSTLAALRRLGIRVALDDFGTGYSSLNYLKRLPLDELKIDRSFVAGVPHDAADAAIIDTVLTLADNLDLRVVAEGVETRAQHDWLLQHGCSAFQGFLFAPPVPAAELQVDQSP